MGACISNKQGNMKYTLKPQPSNPNSKIRQSKIGQSKGADQIGDIIIGSQTGSQVVNKSMIGVSKIQEQQKRKTSRSQTFHKIQKLEQVGMRSEIRQTTGKLTTQKNITAKIMFGAGDMKYQSLNKSTQFKAAKPFFIEDTVTIVRNQDYCQEIKEKVVKSNGSEKKHIFNYDLDVEDGISKTPVVNTFQYKTVLKHNIGSAWNDKLSKIK